MKVLKHWMVMVLVGAAAAACGSDDSEDEGAGGMGGGASGGAGGGTSRGADTSNFTATDLAAGACDTAAMGTEDNPCTGFDEYTACVQTECADGYTECLGANWESGDFAGSPCQEMMECATAADDVCNSGCAASEACETCFGNMAQCVLDNCIGLIDCGAAIPGGGGGAACDELQACCDAQTDEVRKATCDQQVSAASIAGDAACEPLKASFCQ